MFSQTISCTSTADAVLSDDGWHFVVSKFDTSSSGFVPRDYLIPVTGTPGAQASSPLGNRQSSPPPPQQEQKQTPPPQYQQQQQQPDPFTVLTNNNNNNIPISQISQSSPVTTSSTSYTRTTPPSNNNNANTTTSSPPPAPNSIYAARQAPLPFTSTTSSNAAVSNFPRQEISPTNMTKIGPIRRLSDPRLEQHLLETLDPEAVHGTNQYQSTSSIPNYSTNAPVRSKIQKLRM